jgi:hypothetical protein
MEGAESVTIALHGSMTVDVSVGSFTDFPAGQGHAWLSGQTTDRDAFAWVRDLV